MECPGMPCPGMPSAAGNEDDARDLEEAKEKLSQPTKWLLEQKTLLPLLTHLKVLSRKEVNRKAVGAKAIAQLLKHLSDQSVGSKIQAEGANVVLNICYEKENVSAVLVCGGASTLVRARAVGALHNISSDVDSIRVIRRKGGIRWLVRLLHHAQPCVCGSAAGALQNVSREVASRLLIRDSDAIKSLIKLLQSTEVQTQVCAAGALLNVLGPELCDEDNPTPQGLKRREAFVKTITLTLVASIIKQTVFTKETKDMIASGSSMTKPPAPPVINKTSSPTRPDMTLSPTFMNPTPRASQTTAQISNSNPAAPPRLRGGGPPNTADWSMDSVPPNRRAALLEQDANAMTGKQSAPSMPRVD